MGRFLTAAHQVLRERGEPLSAEEITSEALKKGHLSSDGKTPSQTMKAKLATEILRRGERSLFMRSGAGRFALREWEGRIPEHVADRFQAALFDEDILVFPATELGRFVSGPGLHRNERVGSELTRMCVAMRRREAEEDKSVIQLVSVFVVRNGSRVLTYKRTRRLPESRLHGFYSLSFGGHLNPDDVAPLFDVLDAKQWLPWLERELREEVSFGRTATTQIEFRGLLYDDSREVSRQHLGLVYDVKVSDADYRIGERGFLMDPRYESADEIRARLDQFENWSVMLFHSLEGEWQ